MLFLLKSLKLIVCLYIIICGLLFVFQEKLIFFPQKLDNAYQFQFANTFEEKLIKSSEGKALHGLLFKAEQSKGLIFYLHGNAGSLSNWGNVANAYTDLNYDVFILDYRGYGKSEGSIKSEKELFSDVQIAYNDLKRQYAEDSIVVLGYSIGTGIAAKTASVNHPRLLILQAPYYSLTDLMNHNYRIIPSLILRYKFETNKYLKEVKCPVVIFHGDNDEVIYYASSLKLKKDFKKQDTLITLYGQGHNGMTDNENYKEAVRYILDK
jgi:uncharacterized protein